MANEPSEFQSVRAAIAMWNTLHQKRMVWLLVMLRVHSLNVGTGRELGRARGALGAGSRKI